MDETDPYGVWRHKYIAVVAERDEALAFVRRLRDCVPHDTGLAAEVDAFLVRTMPTCHDCQDPGLCRRDGVCGKGDAQDAFTSPAAQARGI